MDHVLREQWNIRYRHCYGRSGSALVDLLAGGLGRQFIHATSDGGTATEVEPPKSAPAENPHGQQIVGTVLAFTSLKERQPVAHWCVVACIDLGQWGSVFGRVVTDAPWTARSIRRRIRIGQSVVALSRGPGVASVAGLAFRPLD